MRKLALISRGPVTISVSPNKIHLGPKIKKISAREEVSKSFSLRAHDRELPVTNATMR